MPMIADDYSILLCSNGHESTRPALEYGVWLAKLLEKPVLLLGIVEDNKYRSVLESLLEDTEVKLAAQGSSYMKCLEEGHSTEVIAHMAHTGHFLTVVGPLGKPAWQRMIQGRSFRWLLAKIETPIIYVPSNSLPLRKMLICMGGLGYTLSLEHLSLVLARAAGASVTVLHVIEPISLDYPTAREIHHHPDNILETDTPQAVNLRLMLDDIRSLGLQAELKVRQGSIVHEILEEVKSGDYDLVGLGSPYSTKSLRHLYMPNVTAEVAEAINQPVLAVRLGQDLLHSGSYQTAADEEINL
jgi:nucleotide-binding universal stress UspA family protein